MLFLWLKKDYTHESSVDSDDKSMHCHWNEDLSSTYLDQNDNQIT